MSKANRGFKPVYYDPDEGDSLHWSNWSDRPQGEDTQPVTMVPYCSGNTDVEPDTVSQSNYRRVKEDFADDSCLIDISGGYGTYGLAFLGTYDQPQCWDDDGNIVDADEDLVTRIQETLCALDSYPLYDESDHSELEMEWETEDWNDWGRFDFRKALSKELDFHDDAFTHDADKLHDGVVDWLWWAGCDAYNVNGGGGYYANQRHFYIDEWCKKAASSKQLRSWTDTGRDYSTIADVARECRDEVIPGIDDEIDLCVEVILTQLTFFWRR